MTDLEDGLKGVTQTMKKLVVTYHVVGGWNSKEDLNQRPSTPEVNHVVGDISGLSVTRVLSRRQTNLTTGENHVPQTSGGLYRH